MSQRDESPERTEPLDFSKLYLPQLREKFKGMQIPKKYWHTLSRNRAIVLLRVLLSCETGILPPSLELEADAVGLQNQVANPFGCFCSDPNAKLVHCDTCQTHVCAWCRCDNYDHGILVMTSCKKCLGLWVEGIPVGKRPPPHCGAGYFSAHEKKRQEDEAISLL